MLSAERSSSAMTHCACVGDHCVALRMAAHVTSPAVFSIPLRCPRRPRLPRRRWWTGYGPCAASSSARNVPRCSRSSSCAMALATNPDSPRAPTRRRTAMASSAGTLTDSFAAGCAILDSYHGRNGRARSRPDAGTLPLAHPWGRVPLCRAHAQGDPEVTSGSARSEDDARSNDIGPATPAPPRALGILEPRDVPINGRFGRACLWGTPGLFEDTCRRPLAPVSAL